MKKIVLSHLQKTQLAQLATSENDQPYVRPMTLIVYQERFFFATGSKDNKSKQIQANPKTEFCVSVTQEKSTGTIRARGIMQVVTDLPTKKAVTDWAEFIYQYWKDYTDADYTLFEFIPDEVEYMAPGKMVSTVFKWDKD